MQYIFSNIIRMVYDLKKYRADLTYHAYKFISMEDIESHYNIALGFVLILVFGNALTMGNIIVKERDQCQ